MLINFLSNFLFLDQSCFCYPCILYWVLQRKKWLCWCKATGLVFMYPQMLIKFLRDENKNKTFDWINFMQYNNN